MYVTFWLGSHLSGCFELLLFAHVCKERAFFSFTPSERFVLIDESMLVFHLQDPTKKAFHASTAWKKAKTAVVMANRFSNEKAVEEDEAKMAELFGQNNELKRSSFVLMGPNNEDYTLKIIDQTEAELMRTPAGTCGSP